jgi:S1-C subfamily serine protease
LRHGELHARVVFYDPEGDVAILYVPHLATRSLAFAGPASSGENAIVAGYPLNAPFTAVAARVGGSERAQSPDIYQRTTVTREIYPIRAVVEPGNSGGPLLAPNGQVYGVVFAAAVSVKNTGYALTAQEVAKDVRDGRSAVNEVSTQACDN